VKLRYTVCAAQELEQVLSHIDDRSPEGSRRVKARVQAVIDLIASHPQAGQRTSAGRLRRVVVHPYPYQIFYAATDDEVVIHGVRHATRRPSSMPE
jgi:plasmid stabilization system protein ParE